MVGDLRFVFGGADSLGLICDDTLIVECWLVNSFGW